MQRDEYPTYSKKDGNCLLKHVLEGKMEGARRRGKRRTQLLDVVNEKRRHWNLKDELLTRTIWRTCFGRQKNKCTDWKERPWKH